MKRKALLVLGLAVALTCTNVVSVYAAEGENYSIETYSNNNNKVVAAGSEQTDITGDVSVTGNDETAVKTSDNAKVSVQYGKEKRVKMAVSKKQPAKKRQKKKSSLWIISLIAVILLILVGVVFLVLPKFRKEAAPEKPETIKVEAAEKSYAAGSRISEKNFRVYGISGKKKQLLDADTYSVSPAKVPAHGHSVTVEVSSKAYPDIKAEITVLIDRDESVRYKIGRENPDDVEAILYSNGDLEISGKGSVRNFKSDSAPWKKYSVQRLTWIDPEAEVESMDYWFTGNDEYLETLCRIPDTVRSMVETFKNAMAMTSMPDMSGAVRLEDITSCAEGCIALEKAMELPGNIKQAKKAFYGDTALIEGADTTACMQLENMDSMYYGCMALASVQIPDSAKELSNICNGCVNLKEVHIPSAAQKMNSSFFGCTALESITGEIPSSCTDSGNLFSGCKFLSGTLTVSCTSRTTLSSSFSDAATAGTGLTIILRYDAEKSQETANTGFYGGTKSADEILNALKASMEAAFNSGSHITITTNADKTEG